MSYILPDSFSKPNVILPRSQIAWLVEQPDDILSATAIDYDRVEGDYTFTSPRILGAPYHTHVIHKYLPRSVASLIPEMWEEVQVAIDQTWGMNTMEWKEVGIWQNMMRVIPGVTNRMMVGGQACRNEDFLENMGKFTMNVITCAAVYLRFTPGFLKPLVGPLVTIPNKRHWRNTTKYTLPIINERLANFRRKQEDPSFHWDEPNDYISWHIKLAMAEGRHDELTPDMISRRLLPVNFAAIHTTALTMTSTIFDLLSSPDTSGWLKDIREEAESVLAEEGGQWTRNGLARCYRSDSAIRESMRVSDFMVINVLRKVMPAEGIENKAEGWRAPQGALLGVDMHSIQHDPDIYPDPDTYNAFRFLRPSLTSDTLNVQSKVDGTGNPGLVTTSDTFLPFSYGRHACPGRFFVAFEMKLVLAYIVMKYEIEPLKERPPNTWFSQIIFPPTKATIRVRRKEGTT